MQKFKFLVDESIREYWENAFFTEEDAVLEDWLKEQWGLVPCVEQPFPAREGGHYFIRLGQGEYVLYVYFDQRWWINERKTHGVFDPQISLSEKELRALYQMVRIGRKKWLHPDALKMLYTYRHQDELRRITLDTKKHFNRFWKKEALAE